MIAVRDIYYNAGVKSIVDYRGDYGKRERNPTSIGEAKRYFGLGIELINQVPSGKNVPFGKSYYGMALALFSEAVVNDAERTLGENASSKRIEARIVSKNTNSEPIPFSTEGQAHFMDTITKFMALVAGHENSYLWPSHIVQLRACRDHPVYTCFSNPGSGTPPSNG
jgi:hypothetical protein